MIKFTLKRRAGQAPLLSTTVRFGHGSLPRSHTAQERPGLVDDDISRGLEALPIPAVNEVDDALPPCTRPGHTLALRDQGGDKFGARVLPTAATAAALAASDAGWSAELRYTHVLEYAPGVSVPPPMATGCSCKGGCGTSAACACAALNAGGELPYVAGGSSQPRLVAALPVVHECGPSCSCPPSCPNRVTQQGLRYRLELFRTADGRGWGVRSWDTIPAGAYIAGFFGLVVTDAAAGELSDDTYLFNMQLSDARAGGAGEAGHHVVIDEAGRANHFTIDALKVGGVARFINHGCAPNLFVQPVLGAQGHRDMRMPMVNLFAGETIPPLTELTYDYGPMYVREKLGGDCRCGAGECASAKLRGGRGPFGEAPAGPAAA